MLPKVHPAAEIFPMMPADDFAKLKADIDKNGQRDPIVYYRGELLDGRNRDKACRELNIQPSECEVDDDIDPLAFVMSTNLHRRHLDASQRAMVAGRVKKYHTAMAKERQKEHGKTAPGKRKESQVENLPPVKAKARDTAGATLKVSGKSVDHATTVLAKGSPELQAAVDAGKVAVSKAAKIAKAVEPAKQMAAVAEAPARTEKTPFDQLVFWWGKADSAAQTRFRLWIDGNCT